MKTKKQIKKEIRSIKKEIRSIKKDKSLKIYQRRELIMDLEAELERLELRESTISGSEG